MEESCECPWSPRERERYEKYPGHMTKNNPEWYTSPKSIIK